MPTRPLRWFRAPALLALASLVPACSAVHPNESAAPFVDLGDKLEESDMHDKAADAYRDALRRDPNAPTAYAGLTRALGSAAKNKEELAVARQYAARFPGSANAHYWLGYALGDNQLHAAAIAEFKTSLRLDPAQPTVHSQLAWTYGQLGQHEKAIAEARIAVAAAPEDKDAQRQLAQRYAGAGLTEEAVVAWRRALTLDPGNVWNHKSLADTYNALDRYPEALEILTAAHAKFPNEKGLWIDLGLSLQKNGKHDEALAALREGEAFARTKLAASPDDLTELNTLAVALEFQDKLDEALALHQRILKVAPAGTDDHTRALSNVGETLTKLGRYKDAIEYYRKAWEASNQPGDLRMLSNAHLYADNPAESLVCTDRWLKENSAGSHTGRYTGIMGYLAALQVKDADPKKYLAAAAVRADAEWPAPCVEYLNGKITDVELLAKAKTNDERTEAHAYIGLNQFFHPAHAANRDAALEHLRWVKLNGNTHYIETTYAKAFLSRQPAAIVH